MATTYSSSLRISKPGNGEQAGTWGSTVNLDFDLLDAAIAGVVAVTLSAATYTLSAPDGGTGEGQNAVLVFGGSPAADVTVTIPARTKVYIAYNNTAKKVTLTTGAGTTAILAAGVAQLVFCDGTNVTRANAGYNPSSDTISASTFVGAVTGNVTGNVTGTLTGAVVAPAGTAGATSVQVGINAGTGLFQPSANQIAVATNGLASLTLDSSGNGTFRGNVSWSSDRRLKRDVREAPVGLKQALRLTPVTFARLNAQRRARRELGLIAQDAQAAHPLAVSQEQGLLTVSLPGVLAILAGAVRDLASLFGSQNAEMRDLRRRVARLERGAHVE